MKPHVIGSEIAQVAVELAIASCLEVAEQSFEHLAVASAERIVDTPELAEVGERRNRAEAFSSFTHRFNDSDPNRFSALELKTLKLIR